MNLLGLIIDDFDTLDSFIEANQMQKTKDKGFIEYSISFSFWQRKSTLKLIRNLSSLFISIKTLNKFNSFLEIKNQIPIKDLTGSVFIIILKNSLVTLENNYLFFNDLEKLKFWTSKLGFFSIDDFFVKNEDSTEITLYPDYSFSFDLKSLTVKLVNTTINPKTKNLVEKYKTLELNLNLESFDNFKYQIEQLKKINN